MPLTKILNEDHLHAKVRMSCPGWMFCHWEIDFPPLYITTEHTTSDANTYMFAYKTQHFFQFDLYLIHVTTILEDPDFQFEVLRHLDFILDE